MDREQQKIEYFKEKAKLYTELVKVSAAFVIAVGGGIVGLLFKLDNKISLPLITIGLWILTAAFFTLVKAWLSAKNYIEEIDKWTGKS